jgi:hypothetical protein
MAGGVNPFGFSMGVLPAPRAPRQPKDLPSAPFGFAPPPSKMQQTLAILNEYNPLPAFERLMKSPMALGGPISEQDIADGLMVSGTVTGGSAAAPKPKNALNMGIRAYHGSPHDFDRFDMSKIGTGEGAQAYGHGLYFADSEGVARSYRDTLSGKSASAADRTALQGKDHLVAAAKSFRDSGYGAEETISEIAKTYKVDPDIARAAYERANPGRMYEVNINADPDTFLDWDKPLFQQPEAVKSALMKLGVDVSPKGVWAARQTKGGKWTVDNAYGQPHGKYFRSQAEAEDFAAEMTAQQGAGGGAFAYGQLGGNAAYPGLDKGQASQKLLEAGVPGIKYADAGSRGAAALPQNDIAYNERLLAQTRQYLDKAKTPQEVTELQSDIAEIERRIADAKAEKHLTRNYVVFDDRLVSIVRKYGIAGASAILGYNILDGVDPAQADELKRIEGNQ